METLLKVIPFEINNSINDIKYTIPYGVKMINATKMWEKGYTGKGVTIAVIDTGCDASHPALAGRIMGGKNFTTDDNSNPNIFTDYQGHGTHVAGTIAANTNEIGITGVAPNSSLYIMKALNKDGVGEISWLVNAVNYAINLKVDIINMSLGSSQNIPELYEIIKKAINNNILVVCAAGNKGDSDYLTNELDYPGAYEEVIEVGAINESLKITSFSNSNHFIDVVAPGENILSTYKNQSYATLSGTSMATPHISGALALLIEWSKEQFGRKLSETEYYAQLIKHTKDLVCDRKLQGNGYLYIEI